MRTRSQGPPVSPDIERDTIPNPQQRARDQAEAIRLTRLAAGGGIGVANSEDTRGNSIEQGEIPPVSEANLVGNVEPQETGENSPENEVQEGGTNQGNTTGEIPPNRRSGNNGNRCNGRR